MIDHMMQRLQQTFMDREIEAKRSGNPGAAKAWAEATELLQEEKRRVFGSPPINESIEKAKVMEGRA